MAQINEEEELESLEDIDVENIIDDDPVYEEPDEISTLQNPFKSSIFPVLIMNKQLKIIYANEACE